MNLVLVEDSNFTSCSASDGGGAISLVMENSLSQLSSLENLNILHVSRTEFTECHSPTGGSAVGLVSNARIDQFSFTAKVEDRYQH